MLHLQLVPKVVAMEGCSTNGLSHSLILTHPCRIAIHPLAQHPLAAGPQLVLLGDLSVPSSLWCRETAVSTNTEHAKSCIVV